MPYRKPNLPNIPTLSEEVIRIWRRDTHPTDAEHERYEKELAICCNAIKERAARGTVSADDTYFSGQ